jgi:endo-1,4-beta-xylanase
MQKIGLAFLMIMLLVSCTGGPAAVDTPTAAPQSPVPATAVPPATRTPEPTRTPLPITTLKEQGALYPYPEQSACGKTMRVPVGAQAIVSGIFGDYALVAYGDARGYLPKASLSEIPSGTPQLSIDQVAWKNVADYSHWSYYSAQDSGSIVVTPEREDQTDWASDQALYPITPPVKFHFGLETSSNRWAAVKLTGTPNGDPWWKDNLRMDIYLSGNAYALGIRDGTTEAYGTEIALPIAASQELSLVFPDAFGKVLQVLDGSGKLVREIDFTRLPGVNLPNGLFPNGWFQFGTTIGPPGTLKVKHFSITTPPSGLYKKSWLDEPGLKDLAASRGILIGTEFSPDMMMDDRYCGIINHDFNLAYISAFTDANLWLSPDTYNFPALDQVVNDAARTGMTLYASHLVWGATESGVLPDWLKNGNYSKEELLVILENHIKTLVGRYKDRVSIWSIANEAPERDQYQGSDFWFDHIGPEYIEKSLIWAREADPNAILILNGDNNSSPRDTDTTRNIEHMYAMVKDFKERGIPVDRVGMQMHYFLPWGSPVMPVKEDVIATMRRFGDLGVKVMITEMDVNLHEMKGTAEEKAQAQTQLYGDMMSACIESGVCAAFSTWGVSDAYSWITCDSAWCVYKKSTPDAAPLMFDVEYNPKPAYYAVRDALLK